MWQIRGVRAGVPNEKQEINSVYIFEIRKAQ